MNYVNRNKIGLQHFYFFQYFSYIMFYIKVFKVSSAKYYQNNKEILQHKAHENIKIFF